jgi:hypothetical protein
VQLEAGAVVPSAVEPNIARPESVREALASVREALGTNGRRVVLVLPEGVSRTLLVDAPPRVRVQEYARFRVSQALPYPASEAIVDALPLGGRRHLCAAVRRGLVEGYEAALGSVGFTLDRVDLAPLAAVAGLHRQAATGDSGVALILGDVAVSLAGFRGGRLDVFRTRRRDAGPDEAERLREEILRTAALMGADAPRRIAIAGSGTVSIVERLRDLGCMAEPAWRAEAHGLPVEAAELAWLGAALG